MLRAFRIAYDCSQFICIPFIWSLQSFLTHINLKPVLTTLILKLSLFYKLHTHKVSNFGSITQLSDCELV